MILFNKKERHILFIYDLRKQHYVSYIGNILKRLLNEKVTRKGKKILETSTSYTHFITSICFTSSYIFFLYLKYFSKSVLVVFLILCGFLSQGSEFLSWRSFSNLETWNLARLLSHWMPTASVFRVTSVEHIWWHLSTTERLPSSGNCSQTNNLLVCLNKLPLFRQRPELFVSGQPVSAYQTRTG